MAHSSSHPVGLSAQSNVSAGSVSSPPRDPNARATRDLIGLLRGDPNELNVDRALIDNGPSRTRGHHHARRRTG
jgi:hypothetical protein